MSRKNNEIYVYRGDIMHLGGVRGCSRIGRNVPTNWKIEQIERRPVPNRQEW